VAGVLFSLFPAKTHFLGDGYTILSLYGSGEPYYLKWTEAGAILILRFVQVLLGGYTQETVTLALRNLSVFSGVIVVFNLSLISYYISKSSKSFFFALATLLFSGSLLLFFGYLEFYPLLWAFGTSFLFASIRYLSTGKGILVTLALYLATVGIHLQALYWLPGVAYLLYRILIVRKAPEPVVRFYLGAVVAIGLAGLVAVVWLIGTRIDILTAFLPLWRGRQDSPEYAILTSKHLWDILNLILVILPGFLGVATLCRARVADEERPMRAGLVWLSTGSLLFLLTIDPVLGMGRDWDLMSLTLLAPALLLLVLARSTCERLDLSVLGGYALVCLSATVIYISSNLRVVASENRYYSLLEHYGSKNRAGWTILGSYYAERKEWDRSRKIATRLENLFPDEGLLLRTADDLANHNYERALQTATLLYQKNPNRVDYIQVLSAALAKTGQQDRAIELYRQAIRLRPYLADQRKELGLILLEVGRYDEALPELRRAWEQDKSLFAAAEGIALVYIRTGDMISAESVAKQLLADGDAAGAHLIRMVVCVNQSDMEQAGYHFSQYKLLGTERSDYSNILEYYGPNWPKL
jgi:tetratricopeptide (TPR) repeat protein